MGRCAGGGLGGELREEGSGLGVRGAVADIGPEVGAEEGDDADEGDCFDEPASFV